MITEEMIARINELYHKSQSAEGLTEAEKLEQKELRQTYIKAIRESLRGNLENIDIKESDGSITHVADIRKNKA